MTTDERRIALVRNDTRINVASLLQEPVGATRELQLQLNRLVLDTDLEAQHVSAQVVLTRLKDAVLVDARVSAEVPLECASCLAEYRQFVEESFSEPYRQNVDVRTGALLTTPEHYDDLGDDEPAFTIDESHELDLGEAIRQWLILAIPMQPSCGAGCQGSLIVGEESADAFDDRFAGLADLLNELAGQERANP